MSGFPIDLRVTKGRGTCPPPASLLLALKGMEKNYGHNKVFGEGTT